MIHRDTQTLNHVDSVGSEKCYLNQNPRDEGVVCFLLFTRTMERILTFLIGAWVRH